MTYPANAGVFGEAKGARPTGSFNGGNYLRDIVFVPAGPESIFPDTKTGRDIDFDGTYYQLGTKFQSSVAGKITQLRVYSLATESGDHTAYVWRNSDEMMIGGPYTWNYGGTTGWIQLDIPDLDIDANTEYTVSVSTGTSAKRNYPNVAADLLVAGGNDQHLTYPVNAGVFGEAKGARPTGSFNGGNYLRDIIFVPAGVSSTTPIQFVEVKLDATKSNIILTWEGDAPLYQLEKASSISGPYQPLGAPQSTLTYTDANALQPGGRAFYRVRSATPP